jgi:ABC-type sugar transport system ATPase subunit
MEHRPGTVTLAVVKVTPDSRIDQVRGAIEREHPNLATVREVNEFGRLDRNLQFLDAAPTSALIITLVIGVIIVMNTILLSFEKRIREFGLLRAIGWSRSRVLGMVFGEDIGISLLAGATGVGLSFVLMIALARLSPLRGIFNAQLTTAVFASAPSSAIVIDALAALFPSISAAMLRPDVALRRGGQRRDRNVRNPPGRRDRQERAPHLLGELHVVDQAGRKPPELSGGERQRIAIARALANEPPGRAGR